MTKLLLIRHGETDDNRNNVFQGQGGGSLNACGREQASRLGTRLAAAGLRVSAIHCSDLSRAVETATIVGEALQCAPVLEPGLREVYLGTWQGLGYEDIATRFPDEWAAWKSGVDIKRGGGESYAELRKRVSGAVDRVVEAHTDGVVVAISHGASIKSFAGEALGIPLAALRKLPGSANTAVNVFEREADGLYRVVVWNDISHLHDPLVGALGRRP